MFNNNSSVSTSINTTTNGRKPPVGKPVLSSSTSPFVCEEDTRTPHSLVCNSPFGVTVSHKKQQHHHREALANITNSHEVQCSSSTNDLNKRIVSNSNLKANTHSTFNPTTGSQCSTKSLNSHTSANGKTNAAGNSIQTNSHSNTTSSNHPTTQQQPLNTSSQQINNHLTENQQTFEQQVDNSPISDSEQDPNAFNDFSMEASDENFSDEEMDESDDDVEQQQATQTVQQTVDPDLYNQQDKHRIQSYMDYNIRNPVNLLPKSSLRTSNYTHLPYDVEDDILTYLFTNQGSKQASPHIWQSVQRNITGRMRSMLVEWIVGVSVSFKLLPETLYLSIDILDRFLCRVCITNIRLLQGYGLTCLFIAAKYFETSPPPLRQLLFAADNTYTRGLILQMESEIYNAIDFDLCSIQSYDFVEKFLELTGYANNGLVKCLAYYICELQLQNFDAMQYHKSTIALASVVIATHVTHNARPTGGVVSCLGGDTSIVHVNYTNNCIQTMYNYYVNMSAGQIPHIFIKDKYSRQSFGSVATIGFFSPLPPSI